MLDVNVSNTTYREAAEASRVKAMNAYHATARIWYNGFLKSADFWTLFSAPNLLLFEVDSILCPQPSIPLDWWLGRFAYVGGPWHRRVGVGALWCKNLVTCIGNSGLSLWNRALIAGLLADGKLPPDFANGTVRKPLLDLWASTSLQRLERDGQLPLKAVPSEELAGAFSCSDPPEVTPGILSSRGHTPFGLHGVGTWPLRLTRSRRMLLQRCPTIEAISVNQSLDGLF